jgi:RNase P subunit RPR2
MAAEKGKVAVRSHTEYSHSRFRCLGCGEIVRAADGERERRLCGDCVSADPE